MTLIFTGFRLVDAPEDDQDAHGEPARRLAILGCRRLAASASRGPCSRPARIPETVRALTPAQIGLGRANARVLLAEADGRHAVERIEHVRVEARLGELLPKAGGLAIGVAIALQEAR